MFRLAGTPGLFDQNSRLLNISPSATQSQAAQNAQMFGLNTLSDLNSLNFQGREAAELARLQQLRAPEFGAARNQLRSQQLARGREGLGVGGGLQSRLFNPQSAALEEAIARAQLGDISAARQMSQQEQAFLMNQAQQGFGLSNQILAPALQVAQLSLGGRSGTSPSAALAAGVPASNAANSTRGFFSGLGQSISGENFDQNFQGFFGGANQGATNFGVSQVPDNSFNTGFFN